jgi:hypothetical protein
MNRIYLATFALLIWGACKDNPDQEKIYFTGITMVDEQGQSLNNGDTTDWRFDDTWNEQENALFGFEGQTLCGASPDSSLAIVTPNPCTDRFIVNILTPYGANWHFKWVDEDFTVIHSYDFKPEQPYFNALSIKTDDFPKDTVRLYYLVERAGCVWRGHGDILVK